MNRKRFSGNKDAFINDAEINSNDNIKIKPKILYRPFEKRDVYSLRLLQNELFPVKYRNSFYNKLLQNHFLSVLAIIIHDDFDENSNNNIVYYNKDFSSLESIDEVDENDLSLNNNNITNNNNNSDNNSISSIDTCINNNSSNTLSSSTSSTSSSTSSSSTENNNINNNNNNNSNSNSNNNKLLVSKPRFKEEIIGVATARVTKETGICSMFFNMVEGYILTLGVKDKYRGLGIGSSLLNKICKELSNVHCTVASLHVKFLNSDALQFYFRNGFKIDERISDYYTIDDNKYDALSMSKSLKKDKGNGWLQWFSSLSLYNNSNNSNNINHNNSNNSKNKNENTDDEDEDDIKDDSNSSRNIHSININFLKVKEKDENRHYSQSILISENNGSSSSNSSPSSLTNLNKIDNHYTTTSLLQDNNNNNNNNNNSPV